MLRRRGVSDSLTGVSYLLERTRHIRCAGRISKDSLHSLAKYGLCRRTRFGSISLILYTRFVVSLTWCRITWSARAIRRRSAVSPADLEVCLADVASWISSNGLQLSTSKMELICCSKPRRRHWVPNNSIVMHQLRRTIHGRRTADAVNPVATVEELGQYKDATNDVYELPYI